MTEEPLVEMYATATLRDESYEYANDPVYTIEGIEVKEEVKEEITVEFEQEIYQDDMDIVEMVNLIHNWVHLGKRPFVGKYSKRDMTKWSLVDFSMDIQVLDELVAISFANRIAHERYSNIKSAIFAIYDSMDEVEGVFGPLLKYEVLSDSDVNFNQRGKYQTTDDGLLNHLQTIEGFDPYEVPAWKEELSVE